MVIQSRLFAFMYSLHMPPNSNTLRPQDREVSVLHTCWLKIRRYTPTDYSLAYINILNDWLKFDILN